MEGVLVAGMFAKGTEGAGEGATVFDAFWP
jgi:hypothetical protein